MSDDGQPILTVLGLVAVGLGVLMVFQPGLAAAIGTGYSAVTVVGLLALVQGLRVARARKASDIQGAETPDVETVESVPTPGDDFDRTVAELQSGPHRNLIRERANVHDTLEAVAITAVADRENCSRERASELVAAGTWTDDPHAAAFLGGAGIPRPPLLDRLKVAASGESTYQFRVRRAADAIARTAGVTDDGGGTTDSAGVTDDGGGTTDSAGVTDDGGGTADSAGETRDSTEESNATSETTEPTGDVADSTDGPTDSQGVEA